MRKEIFYKPIPEGWYYWDETWSYETGPFASYEEAERALNRYIKFLEEGYA